MAKTDKRADESLLTEIRDTYDYHEDQWHDAREEAKADMRAVSGDPWDPEERELREETLKRPCITVDELNQYTNKLVNDVRQAKRGIVIDPKGNGANDQTARLHQEMIRGIEDKSKAQLAYMTMFENMVERSYGAMRIKTRYVGDGWDMEAYIEAIQNPDTVLPDPDCKMPDYSDQERCFVIDSMRKDDFEAKHPNSDFKSFDMGHAQASKWIQDKTILVAEYWKRILTTRKLFLLNMADLSGVNFKMPDRKIEQLEFKGKPAVAFYEDELPKDIFSASDLAPLRERKVEKKTVKQYITNGFEILEKHDWPGSMIPIIFGVGRERWIDDGSGSKRVLFSLVRLARDPFMAYCYLWSQEMEEAGMAPRSPFIGYEGQFEGHEEEWKVANRSPLAFLQVKVMTDASNGQVLPKPERQPFVPNFAAYSLAKEDGRRAIQAAMGINPLPTAAQRQNDKSGVALNKIDAQQSQGSYHFVDNFNNRIELAGRMLEELIPIVYDTERDVNLVANDDKKRVVTINKPGYQDEQTGEEAHYDTKTGEHGVTVSVGASQQSERERADDFVDTLVANMKGLPVDPRAAQKILSRAIKLKNLGPIGDEIADLLDPPQDPNQQIPPQVQQAMQQLQQQLQAINAVAQQREQEVKKLEDEKQAKIVDNEYRMKIEQMKIEAQVTIAEITTKAQNVLERAKLEADVNLKLGVAAHEAAHEAGMAAADRVHESAEAEAARAHEADQSDADRAAAAAQQRSQQEADQQAAEAAPTNVGPQQ